MFRKKRKIPLKQRILIAHDISKRVAVAFVELKLTFNDFSRDARIYMTLLFSFLGTFHDIKEPFFIQSNLLIHASKRARLP